jgi:hypothetical protein
MKPEPNGLSAKQREKQRIEAQKKQVRMLSVWTAWVDFEKPLRTAEPDYLKFLYDTVKAISNERQTAQGEKNALFWDEARNRIMSDEFMERNSKRFGKHHRTIHADVGRVASHNSWVSGVNRRGEYWILAEIQREYARVKEQVKPVIEQNQLPLQRPLTREEREVVTREFLAEDPKPMTPAFDFITDVDRQIRQKERPCRTRKPRRNWRCEVGIS